MLNNKQNNMSSLKRKSSLKLIPMYRAELVPVCFQNHLCWVLLGNDASCAENKKAYTLITMLDF